MTISEDIRALARDGHSTAEIARRLGIRYQHAYNVLRADRGRKTNASAASEKTRPPAGLPASNKPPLTVDVLIAGGFSFTGRWVLSKEGDLILDRPAGKGVAVYAFAKAEVVFYVGVATMGLAKRLYFYGRPGITQRTSQRLNKIIKEELRALPCIDIYAAAPPDFEWNGLPVQGSVGLELGLIKRFNLPWNMRGAR